MPRYPDFLYQLLSGDAGDQLLEVVWRRATTTAITSGTDLELFRVPKDKILIVSALTVEVLAAADQQVRSVRGTMLLPTSGQHRFFGQSFAGMVDGQIAYGTFSGEVLALPDWRVFGGASLDLPATANSTITADLHGVMIPRGTFIA